MSKRKIARECVRGIEKDIRGRMGIGNEWDRMDTDIRHEIEDAWEKIVVLALNKILDHYSIDPGGDE